MKISVDITYGFVLQRMKIQLVCVQLAAAIPSGAVTPELETSAATNRSCRKRHLLGVTRDSLGVTCTFVPLGCPRAAVPMSRCLRLPRGVCWEEKDTYCSIFWANAAWIYHSISCWDFVLLWVIILIRLAHLGWGVNTEEKWSLLLWF